MRALACAAPCRPQVAHASWYVECCLSSERLRAAGRAVRLYNLHERYPNVERVSRLGCAGHAAAAPAARLVPGRPPRAHAALGTLRS